jgi:hypothetical protein
VVNSQLLGRITRKAGLVIGLGERERERERRRRRKKEEEEEEERGGGGRKRRRRKKEEEEEEGAVHFDGMDQEHRPLIGK